MISQISSRPLAFSSYSTAPMLAFGERKKQEQKPRNSVDAMLERIKDAIPKASRPVFAAEVQEICSEIIRRVALSPSAGQVEQIVNFLKKMVPALVMDNAVLKNCLPQNKADQVLGELSEILVETMISSPSFTQADKNDPGIADMLAEFARNSFPGISDAGVESFVFLSLHHKDMFQRALQNPSLSIAELSIGWPDEDINHLHTFVDEVTRLTAQQADYKKSMN